MARSFWLNGVALRLLVYFALVILTQAQPLPAPIFLVAVVLDALVFIWQATGYFRAAEHNLSGTGSLLPLWGGMIALIIAVFIMFAQWWGLVLAANPAPEEEHHFAKLERYRAAQYALNVSDDGNTILISGTITHGVTKKLRELLEVTPDVITVHLESEGGNIFEARGLAGLIRQKGLSTHVAQICASACTTVFMAGDRRSADAGARLGFHGYALQDAAQLPRFDIEAEQDRDREFFRNQGASEPFLTRMFQTASPSIWFPDHATLRNSGVLRD